MFFENKLILLVKNCIILTFWIFHKNKQEDEKIRFLFELKEYIENDARFFIFYCFRIYHPIGYGRYLAELLQPV